MTIEQLRLKHPRLTYKACAFSQRDDVITITYEFVLDPDITFRPTVQIPFSGMFDAKSFSLFAFHIGMMEAVSYWKLACPKEIVIEAGDVSPEQIRFWQDLYIHGLGEFYYQNQIDFTQHNFLTIVNNALSPNGQISYQDNLNKEIYQHSDTLNQSDNDDLVLVGGGKDSAVTLALLQSSGQSFMTMVVNPTEASLANISAAGLPKPLIIKRVMDAQLIALNAQGYLNGHTPFSAYLAFLGVAVASLYENPRVIVSNERSADEGNVVYKGLEINHQYSKSFRFEELFRAYCNNFLTPVIHYFSLMRPLNDVQLGMLFSKHSEFFTTFRSCNVGSKTNSWCGTCAKCAFTYLILYPHLSHEQMVISFGADLFQIPEITIQIRALVGLSPVKPFECVGTRDEAMLALLLCVEKYKNEKREIPEGLLRIKSDLNKTDSDTRALYETVVSHWGDTYNVPPDYMPLLRQAWTNVSNT